MPPPSLSERYNLEEEEGERRMLQTVDDDDFEEEEEEEDDEHWKSSTKDLLRRHSVSSFNTKSSPTSSTTTVSYSIPSSPPQISNTDHDLWKETIAKLKRTLIVSPPATPPAATTITPVVVTTKNKKRLNKFIPMPIPPRRPISQKRRSEATTQPRFNPDTNTYTRDTRSNPDHLRMISAELNMMRGRKLLSPLKPRGFLPRRKDAFIRGMKRKPSPLIFQ
jgi:hypothetical protein